MSKNKTSAAKTSKKTTAKKAPVRKKAPAKKAATNKKATTVKKPVAKKSPEIKTSNTENKTPCCKKIKLSVAALIILVAGFLFVKFNNKSDTSSQEVKINKNESVSNVGDVEKVIAAWVQNNPELIIESVMNMQKKQARQQVEDASKNISKRMKDIYSKKSDPVFAPKGYNATVVEFFDYNCGYCKRALKTLEQLTKDDKKVRIIFKELPILGKSSEDLSKVSIAFNMAAPSKYFAFHRSLMASKAKTTSEAIAIAKSHGVSEAKINKVLSKFASKINEQIAFNRELAASVGINGTPAFLIGETLLPGAVDVGTIKAEVTKSRK